MSDSVKKYLQSVKEEIEENRLRAKTLKNTIILFGDSDKEEDQKRVEEAKEELLRLNEDFENLKQFLYIPILKRIDNITEEEFEEYKNVEKEKIKEKIEAAMNLSELTQRDIVMRENQIQETIQNFDSELDSIEEVRRKIDSIRADIEGDKIEIESHNKDIKNLELELEKIDSLTLAEYKKSLKEKIGIEYSSASKDEREDRKKQLVIDLQKNPEKLERLKKAIESYRKYLTGSYLTVEYSESEKFLSDGCINVRKIYNVNDSINVANLELKKTHLEVNTDLLRVLIEFRNSLPLLFKSVLALKEFYDTTYDDYKAKAECIKHFLEIYEQVDDFVPLSVAYFGGQNRASVSDIKTKQECLQIGSVLQSIFEIVECLNEENKRIFKTRTTKEYIADYENDLREYMNKAVSFMQNAITSKFINICRNFSLDYFNQDNLDVVMSKEQYILETISSLIDELKKSIDNLSEAIKEHERLVDERKAGLEEYGKEVTSISGSDVDFTIDVVENYNDYLSEYSSDLSKLEHEERLESMDESSSIKIPVTFEKLQEIKSFIEKEYGDSVKKK